MEILEFVVQTLVGELLVVVVGVLFANYIKARWDEWRHGGWFVRVEDGEQVILNRAISPRKAKELLEETADLAVFLKGVVSPYAFLNCDLIEDGQTIGLLTIDEQQRRFVIDLEKNPTRKELADQRRLL